MKQLRDQKKELVRETLEVIKKLNLSENIHTYVSIGDSGKIVLRLKKALSILLIYSFKYFILFSLTGEEMRGSMYVVHDKPRPLDRVERGSLKDVGNFVPIDYSGIHITSSLALPLPLPSSLPSPLLFSLLNSFGTNPDRPRECRSRDVKHGRTPLATKPDIIFLQRHLRHSSSWWNIRIIISFMERGREEERRAKEKRE